MAHLPSGKRLQSAIENLHVEWKNQRTEWPYSIANCKRLPEATIIIPLKSQKVTSVISQTLRISLRPVLPPDRTAVPLGRPVLPALGTCRDVGGATGRSRWLASNV